MEQFIGTVGASPTLLPSSGGRTSGSYFVPLANGSRADCVTYVTPPVQVVGANGEGQASYECLAVAKAYGVSLSDLLAWNPGVNQTGGFNYPCELLGTLRYCVQPVPIIAPDSTANCSFTAVADPGWSCERYSNRYNITVAALVAWNLSVGDKCTGFRGGILPVPSVGPAWGNKLTGRPINPGTTYCAAVHHFQSKDVISTCSFWATASTPTTDVCGEMEAKNKLEHRRFLAWNPSVLNDCEFLSSPRVYVPGRTVQLTKQCTTRLGGCQGVRLLCWDSLISPRLPNGAGNVDGLVSFISWNAPS